ncbi:hypothetical protein [Gordonia sp. YY1]|uniref:hypothetical protein n=1 Tax=Gordonia sp. YY1 TaxID=396712 RepID=UPI00133142D1|nr:hypothetical protein [Gordonia sp. YY1]KAF0969027.1 hypothetical protein BPODLACK_02257 [Gordonia sp. YY1]
MTESQQIETRRSESRPQGSQPSGSGGPTPDDTRRRRTFRWRQHIGGTSIRISTALLLVAFVLCGVLYGYTSQRYGVVAPEPPRPAPRTSQVVEPTYRETPPSTFSETTSETPSDVSTTDEPGFGGTDTSAPSGGTRSPSTPSTTRQTVPGLPGVEIPNLGAPAPTTPVPTR